MRIDARTEMTRHHLCAEADAEERALLAQGHADPVDLALDVVVTVVCAHRPAEDHDAGVTVHRLGQRVAKTRTADVEREAKLAQGIADTAGLRLLAVQNDQDWPPVGGCRLQMPRWINVNGHDLT